MPRTPGSKNKFNPEKEAKKLQEQIGTLAEESVNANVTEGMIRSGFNIGVLTLVKAAMGNDEISGLSATNRITAAKELKDLGLNVLGKKAFTELEEKAEEEADDDLEEFDSRDENVFKLKSYKD